MGEPSARSDRGRDGATPSRKTAAQPAWDRAAQTHSDARLRHSSSLDCASHHGSRSQGTPPYTTGRSDLRSEASRRHGALWRHHDARCPRPAIQAHGAAHRRRYDLLLRRLVALYPDEVIAGIFNRQGRRTATGERFTANHVGNLRRYRNIPRFQPPAESPMGELVSIRWWCSLPLKLPGESSRKRSCDDAQGVLGELGILLDCFRESKTVQLRVDLNRLHATIIPSRVEVGAAAVGAGKHNRGGGAEIRRIDRGQIAAPGCASSGGLNRAWKGVASGRACASTETASL
jgi:hypothetical protein